MRDLSHMKRLWSLGLLAEDAARAGASIGQGAKRF